MGYDIFDKLKFPVCVLSISGDLIFKNTVFSEIFSSELDNENTIALDVSHPLYSEYRRQIALSYHKALSGVDTRCFAVLRGADNTQIPVEIYLYPMSLDSCLPGILAFFKRVDDRAVSFDQSVMSDPLSSDNQNLFEFSPFPIVRLNPEGEITMVSSSVERITGFPKDELFSDSSKFYEIFTAYDAERIKNSVKDVLGGLSVFKRLNDIKIVTRKNEKKYANAVFYSIMSERRIVAVEILFEDTTVISNLEKRLTSKNRENILGDMFEGLLHSFSNIMNIVMNRSQMMMQQTEKDVLLDGLKSIYDSANDGARQIKRIQDFVGETSDDEEESSEEILSLIDDAVEFSKMQFKVEERDKIRDVKISKHFFVKGVITGNIKLLREIFVSMIFRIANYIEQDGEIEVDIRQSTDYIFSVSAKKKSHGYENEYLSDIEIRRLAELAHLRVIEEESADSISIKVSIPAKMISKEAILSPKDEVHRLRDLDVLIIEDEAALREVLRELFDNTGNRVTLCVDSFSAEKEIGLQKFDLVISDYGIPGKTGLELLAEVKKLMPSAVTVLFSGWNLNIKSGEDFVDLYIPKPFQLDILLREISKKFR